MNILWCIWCIFVVYGATRNRLKCNYFHYKITKISTDKRIKCKKKLEPNLSSWQTMAINSIDLNCIEYFFFFWLNIQWASLFLWFCFVEKKNQKQTYRKNIKGKKITRPFDSDIMQHKSILLSSDLYVVKYFECFFFLTKSKKKKKIH